MRSVKQKLVFQEELENKILFIRGQKVMLDRDLAKLYGVETRVLNQAVHRNIERFPEDFMFSLTREEVMRLSQFVISSGIKYAPRVHVFTEQGVSMLSSVLRSKRAVQVNIQIMRVFVRLRQMLSGHKDLMAKLDELEKRLTEHDHKIENIFEAIRQLIKEEDKPKARIGFHVD